MLLACSIGTRCCVGNPFYELNLGGRGRGGEVSTVRVGFCFVALLRVWREEEGGGEGK